VKFKTPILLITLVLGIIVAFFIIKPSHGPKITKVGSEAPDTQLTDISENRLRLSDMKGSVVFINFWATWCGSCVEEMPSIERLSRLLSENTRFRIVTILYKDDLGRAISYMKQNGYTFPVYLNPDESAARSFGITGVPETFILDKKGILREKVIGPAPWDAPEFIQALQNLINEA
jgi:cytochrome c biogenesis protein CcmG, thiol:disulfide interchange protein DsbE